MKETFCKVPSSVAAFQGKISTAKLPPQLILAHLYTWFKEVKVVVPTLTLLKKLFRHFLTLMLQQQQQQQQQTNKQTKKQIFLCLTNNDNIL
jgi:hypothetical protein